jgi:putative aldouronate transport system permease protein
MVYHKTPMDRAADFIIYVILIAAALSCIFPIIHILAVSFSSSGPASAGLVSVWPVLKISENEPWSVQLK